jgi:hypothetical protein
MPNLNWRAAYDQDEAIIYLLDPGLRIARCNASWDRFALANGGEATVSSKVVGTPVMDAVPPHLRPFYFAAYDTVQRFRRVWWHIFECSSPDFTRIYQMRIVPDETGSLLTVNTLIGLTPLETAPPKPIEDYTDNNGIAIMCSNCRRVRRLRPPAGWDWVPELLIGGEILVTFGLCNFCAVYHYHSDE